MKISEFENEFFQIIETAPTISRWMIKLNDFFIYSWRIQIKSKFKYSWKSSRTLERKLLKRINKQSRENTRREVKFSGCSGAHGLSNCRRSHGSHLYPNARHAGTAAKRRVASSCIWIALSRAFRLDFVFTFRFVYSSTSARIWRAYFLQETSFIIHTFMEESGYFLFFDENSA